MPQAGELSVADAIRMAEDQGLYEERDLSSVLHNFHIYKYIQGRMSSQRVILQVQWRGEGQEADCIVGEAMIVCLCVLVGCVLAFLLV